MSYAQSVIAGNIATDLELRTLPSSDTTLLEFSVAVNPPGKQGKKQEASFFVIQAWEKQAELIQRTFSKGDAIALVCEMRVNKWTDKETGHTRKREIHAVRTILQLPKRAGGSASRDEASAPPPKEAESKFTDQESDEIPF